VAYVIFALRLLIGGTLVIAGLLKAHDGPVVTAGFVAGYRILPPALVAPLGVALPYAEIVLGAYLLAGFLTRGAAWVATAQFALFAGAVGSLVLRGIPADCGCFGSGVPTPPSWWHVAADVALGAMTAAIALRGPGTYALDRMLAMSGARESRTVVEP